MEAWPREKKENYPAAANRRKKKEETDTKRLRPKADQVLSSVSAAPSLVNSINLLLKRRLKQQSILVLVYFSGLVFWRSFDNVSHQRSCVPYACRMHTSTHRENSTGTISTATRPGILGRVTSSCPDDAYLTWCLERGINSPPLMLLLILPSLLSLPLPRHPCLPSQPCCQDCSCHGRCLRHYRCHILLIIACPCSFCCCLPPP